MSIYDDRMLMARRVALLSDDLMFRSQLEAAVTKAGGEMVAVTAPEAVPDVDSVFVDLNADSPHRLGFIATLREQRPSINIVAFCHHGEKQLREAAMNVGASSCITNGALQAVALRLSGLPVAGTGRSD
jgi:DNA-binding NarL/FixJ family response regulator